MKIELINKHGLFEVIKAILTIVFIYFTLGYILGYMHSPKTINKFDNEQQNTLKNILSVNGINYQNNITEISYQSILKTRFYVVKISNNRLNKFKEDNPNIDCYKFGGRLEGFPAGFHAPYAYNGFSCYYFFDTLYISFASDTIVGKNISDIFWEIYDKNDNSKKYYISFYILFIIYLGCMVGLEKTEKIMKHKNRK